MRYSKQQVRREEVRRGPAGRTRACTWEMWMGRVFCKVPRRKRNRRDGTILGGRGMHPQQQSMSWRSERPRRLRSADRQDPCARPRSGQPGSHPQCRTDSLAGGMAGFLSGQPFPDKRWPDPMKPGSCCERLLGLPEPREGRKGGRRRPPGLDRGPRTSPGWSQHPVAPYLVPP